MSLERGNLVALMEETTWVKKKGRGTTTRVTPRWHLVLGPLVGKEGGATIGVVPRWSPCVVTSLLFL